MIVHIGSIDITWQYFYQKIENTLFITALIITCISSLTSGIDKRKSRTEKNTIRNKIRSTLVVLQMSSEENELHTFERQQEGLHLKAKETRVRYSGSETNDLQRKLERSLFRSGNFSQSRPVLSRYVT